MEKQLTAARYVKLKGVPSIKALTDFMGYTRHAVDYRFNNDREILDSDINRYLKSVAEAS